MEDQIWSMQEVITDYTIIGVAEPFIPILKFIQAMNTMQGCFKKDQLSPQVIYNENASMLL